MAVLLALVVVLPLLALVIEHVGNVRISERHHSHHDTYVIPVSFTRSLVFAMLAMGALGVGAGALCHSRVFHANEAAVVGFFAAFVTTLFVFWAFSCRYRVSAFDELMVVRPFVGPSVLVRYEDIDHMEWVGMTKGSGYRNLAVVSGGQRVATVYGFVDVEQILMRIDRFDVLSHTT